MQARKGDINSFITEKPRSQLTVVSLQPLSLLKSEVHDEKQAVNRLTICTVIVVSMSQKQLIETTSPTIDLHDLFPK